MAIGKKTGGRDLKPGEGGRKPGAKNHLTRLKEISAKRQKQFKVRDDLKQERLKSSPDIFKAFNADAKEGNRLSKREMDSMIKNLGEFDDDFSKVVADVIRSLKKKVDFKDYLSLKEAWLDLRFDLLESPEIVAEIDRKLQPYLDYALEEFERRQEAEKTKNQGIAIINNFVDLLIEDPYVKEKMQGVLPKFVSDIERKYGISAGELL